MVKLKAFIKKNLFNIIWIAMAVVLFVVDIITKQIIMRTMNVGDNIPVIGNFLSINYVINEGAAFGIQFKDPIVNKVMWIVISILGSAGLIFFFVWKNNKLSNITKASLMLMASGALGNLIDRAFYTADYLGIDKVAYPNGGVVDFIGANFGKLGEFPRFNVADSCLVIGTFMLIIVLFISEVKEILNKKKEVVPESAEKVLSKDELERLELEAKDKADSENE